jgi:hypothetical protein
MRFEGFFASFSPSFDPVAHRSLAYSQCHGYVFLLPAFLFQFPRSFSSFFSPIGFLWCSHASYLITLVFLLPRSVEARDQLASMLATEDYAQIEWELFMLNIPACIASTAAYIPIIENQDTDILNGTLSFTAQDVLTFSLFPDNTQMKSYCVLSRFKGSQRADYSRVAFRQLSKSDLQDVLFATAFRQGNVCIAPAWWNSLKREDKQQLKEIHLDF